MAKVNPAQFVREVRQEVGKVVFPSRKETILSTTIVLVLVTIASMFFVLVDWMAGSLIRVIIGI